MARMESRLEDASGFGVLDEGWYTVHCYEADGENDGVRQTDSGADMWTGHFEVDEGPKAGQQVRYHNVMLAGMSKKGKPINTGMPGGLCEFVNAAKVSWECGGCGKESKGGLVTGAHAAELGLDKTKFYCPNCKGQAVMKYDTADFVGPQCKAYISIGEDNKGRPRNSIDRFLPVGHPETMGNSAPHGDGGRRRR